MVQVFLLLLSLLVTSAGLSACLAMNGTLDMQVACKENLAANRSSAEKRKQTKALR